MKHIAFTALGKTQEIFSRGMFLLLVLLGIAFSQVWLLWALLLVVLGVEHPPTSDLSTPLDTKTEAAVRLLCLVVLVVTFAPDPMRVFQ